jgi:glycogen debranching enzyme
MHEPTTITIPPLLLTIHYGGAMVVTNREGWVQDGLTGIYHYDTRYLNAYDLSFDGLKPTFLTSARNDYNWVVLSYTNPPIMAGPRPINELELMLQVTRVLREDLTEFIEITSFAPLPVDFNLVLHFETSFDTVLEVRGLHVKPPRIHRTSYDFARRILSSDYDDVWFHRRLECCIECSSSAPRYTPGALVFPIHLTHAETWQAQTRLLLTGVPVGRFASSLVNPPKQPAQPGKARSNPEGGVAAITALPFQAVSAASDELERWESRLARVETPAALVRRSYRQAIRDLGSLRFQRVETSWYPAAGVPWFNCIFGRDALITAFECLAFGDPFSLGVLERLSQLQGVRVNDFTDEEPGKIPHELRTDQSSLSGLTPYNPYYATVDATLLYVILLSEAFRYNGDIERVRRFLGPAERCLAWARDFGDIDGDGFIEYWQRWSGDYRNQSWKDAYDAVVYPDGTIVPTPITIVEVQGYYYDALRRAAELYRALGEIVRAETADTQADRLFDNFNERFWLDDVGYYAYGLDPNKNHIRTIASNPGHLLWSGIVPTDRAKSITHRLFANDMFCGWGVRSLSSQNQAFDPISYQRGSVWPQDNAIIALGLKRYGFWEEANRIAEGIFAASGFFEHGQIPELWGGLERATTRWPVIYPRANVPQAWAAGSLLLLIRAILGAEPDPKGRGVVLNPTLPEWLPEIDIRGLNGRESTIDVGVSGLGTNSIVRVLQSYERSTRVL